MTWWCAASNEPWDWSSRAYPGIWLFMVLLLVGYLWVCRERPDRRKRWFFLGGWALLWASTDWPLGTLGSGYLASAHMAQYLLYTMAAAPLLMLSLPEAPLRRGLSRLRAYRLVRLAARPLVAGVIFNIVLLVTHAPVTVDTMRTNQAGSFLLDLAWLASGLLLWLPVCGPLDELKPSYPARCVYLFLAAGLVPMIPGGFLTFAPTPLYSVYELAPRVGGFDALDDQQAAGVIMKVGNLPLLWPVLGGLFLRWAAEDRVATPPVQVKTADKT
jgi:cytochrome c oxidase assembly factor CtaG